VTVAPLIALGLLAGAATAAAGRGRLPSAGDVAGALTRETLRSCRDLIDACVDENGNSTVPVPEFTVSELKCRPVSRQRAACSFVSELRAENPYRERCTATLQYRLGAYSDIIWEFAALPSNGRRRLSPDPILECKLTHQGI
jgi:hypothetical protein